MSELAVYLKFLLTLNEPFGILFLDVWQSHSFFFWQTNFILLIPLNLINIFQTAKQGFPRWGFNSQPVKFLSFKRNRLRTRTIFRNQQREIRTCPIFRTKQYEQFQHLYKPPVPSWRWILFQIVQSRRGIT